MRDHRGLVAFRLADALAKLTYAVTQNWSTTEQFGLTLQMRRAAVSVASNIVEGCGRETDVEFRRYLVIAHSSCRELGYQVSLAVHLGYVVEIEGELKGVELGNGSGAHKSLIQLSDETSRVLAKLIQSVPVPLKAQGSRLS